MHIWPCIVYSHFWENSCQKIAKFTFFSRTDDNSRKKKNRHIFGGPVSARQEISIHDSAPGLKPAGLSFRPVDEPRVPTVEIPVISPKTARQHLTIGPNWTVNCSILTKTLRGLRHMKLGTLMHYFTDPPFFFRFFGTKSRALVQNGFFPTFYSLRTFHIFQFFVRSAPRLG